jgi:hypothetical protein
MLARLHVSSSAIESGFGCLWRCTLRSWVCLHVAVLELPLRAGIGGASMLVGVSVRLVDGLQLMAGLGGPMGDLMSLAVASIS